MAFTYDLSTVIGKLRLRIVDTDPTDYSFKDEELQVFLDAQQGNIYLAAAEAFGTIVRSRALLAARTKREGYESQEQALSDLRQQVKDLQEMAITEGGLQTIELSLGDEHFESYRPGWRDELSDVVE